MAVLFGGCRDCIETMRVLGLLLIPFHAPHTLHDLHQSTTDWLQANQKYRTWNLGETFSMPKCPWYWNHAGLAELLVFSSLAPL